LNRTRRETGIVTDARNVRMWRKLPVGRTSDVRSHSRHSAVLNRRGSYLRLEGSLTAPENSRTHSRDFTRPLF
jgi:hypothetical protein